MRISPNDVGNSAAGEADAEDSPDDAMTPFSEMSGKRSTNTAQLKQPEEGPRDNADLAAAVEKAMLRNMTEARKRLEAETFFEGVLQDAISAIMVEAKAIASAAHDQLFHAGYYRAVKAEIAAKAAGKVADESIAAASQKAVMVGREVVFKKLLEQSELGHTATVKDYVDEVGKRAREYVQNAEKHLQDHPKVAGLETLLAQTEAMEEQVRARRGKSFDSAAMTAMMLGLIRVMNRALYFEYKIIHESKSVKRALQQENKLEMSKKMKSEAGLHGFLKHIGALERILNGQTVTQEQVQEVRAAYNYRAV